MPGFITGPFSNVLAPGEVVTGVRVPRPGPGARWGYWKFTRKIGEFAKASAAVLLDGSRSRIAVGALEQVPILLPLSALDDPEAALNAALAGREPGSLALHAFAVARAAAIASGTPQ
jgi:carbon-monoxide dehydrogenase medium subunit